MLALAIHFEAEFIVTRNLRHFPADRLMEYRIHPIDPDHFIDGLFSSAPERVGFAAEAHRTSLRDALDHPAYLAALERAELPRAAARLQIVLPPRELLIGRDRRDSGA